MYVTLELVKRAIQGIRGRPPLAIVSIPALLRAGANDDIDPTSAAGVPFGQSNEEDVLNSYFRLPRPPAAAKPYRAVWDLKEDSWVSERYAGTGLQRTRKDRAQRNSVLEQISISGGPDRWRIRSTGGQELVDEWTAKSGTDPRHASVRLIDLAIWYGRERETASLNALLDWFLERYQPEKGDLVGTLYTSEIPDSYSDLPLAESPLDDDDSH